MFSIDGYAQKNNVQNAFRAFEKEKIEEAVEYIELAASNSSTSNDVKMHNYRGKYTTRYIVTKLSKH